MAVWLQLLCARANEMRRARERQGCCVPNIGHVVVVPERAQVRLEHVQNCVCACVISQVTQKRRLAKRRLYAPGQVQEAAHDAARVVQVIQRLKQRHHPQRAVEVRGHAPLRSHLKSCQGALTSLK
eukprot:1155839-Pelagomonas_calceolata.AAC.5